VLTGRGDHRVVICRCSHIFYKIDSQMVVRLLALFAGQPYFTLERSLLRILLEVKSTQGHSAAGRIM
jgi:hypothetical protein